MGTLHSMAHDYDYLHHTLNAMARRVQNALHDSLQALRRSDTIGAGQIIHDDPDINALQQDIEDLVARFITQWQPVLRDLRRVLAILAVAGELERIGDYAKQVASYVRRARDDQHPLMMTTELLEMGNMTEDILSTSIAAFLAEDPAAARTVAALDDRIDARRHEIIAAIRQTAIHDRSSLDAVIASIAITHILERVADRATNIAERTIYLATAAHESLNE